MEKAHPIKAYGELLADLQLLYEKTIDHGGAEQALKCLSVYSYKQLRAMSKAFSPPNSGNSPEDVENTYLHLREGVLIGHFTCYMNISQIANEAMFSPTWNYEKIRSMWIEIIEDMIKEIQAVPIPPTQGDYLAA